MKKSTVLTIIAALIGTPLLPAAVLAHGNSADHAAHDQRRAKDHARHDQGISWQTDRQIHAQERQIHRAQHQQGPYNAGNLGYQSFGNASPYVGPGYYNGNNQGGLRGAWQNWLGGSSAYGANNGYNANGRAYAPPANGIVNGSAYGWNNGYYTNGGAYTPYANGIGNGSVYAGQTANGHTYTADGHRLDHHGNHDDGPGDY